MRAGTALALGALAGYACVLLRTPIPWMLGPLFTIAALRVAGVDIGTPIATRYIGQWIIGTSLGLYFTPYVVHLVADLWWLLVVGALFAIALGYVSGIVLAHVGKVDKTTGIFASVPGGAAEMGTLGERFGGRMDRIAAAQSLRILIVVGLVPAAITAVGFHGADVYVPGATTFRGGGFASLMAATLVMSLAMLRLRMPNAFVLGSLMVAIPLTAAQVELSSVPTLVSNGGQCLLGCAIGSRFRPDFVRGAHKFIGAVVFTIVFSIALSAAFGLLLAWVSGLPGPTLVLGTAPGGITEMCITAKVLQLGVPLVTAFHVTRLVVLLLVTPVVFARARTWYRARKRRAGANR
ncbi:MAG TPA: AbrB family transcriptional regulator [Casimicrobiaceae bacterium]|nr:AbrB family transcriptional regulator [Casimicrobiaceae bacterium]